ncbi:hypothetical protein CO614_10615 [Lysobacteraceae bacterium NML120232]|nr:hypothetical protein CO614_10615 [Xanthomonadaceae bacterium NML120232]
MECPMVRSDRRYGWLKWTPVIMVCLSSICAAQEVQEDTKELEHVVVKGDGKEGEVDALEIGRVITSDEISRYSDASVGAVLRRQPGIIVEGYSATSANRVRLRGLGGGYVRILVNGMPTNLPLDEISASEVERIIVSSAPLPQLPGGAVSFPVKHTFQK